MSDLPDGANYWSVNREISDLKSRLIYNVVFLSMVIIAGLFLMSKILGIFDLLNFYSSTIPIVIAIIYFFKIIQKTATRMSMLNMVAIGEGHPWHPSEEIGDTSVWVRDAEKWHKIAKGVRLFAQSDPIIERTLLKNNDENGKILLTWPYMLDSEVKKLIALVNQALAFQDAQDRIEGQDDPIETARGREKQEFYPVEREWQETTPGSLTPQPGALLRQIKVKSSDIIQKDKE